MKNLWDIFHIILALLLVVNSCWAFNYVENRAIYYFFTSFFFLVFEVIIIIYPFVPVLKPYFGFLDNPVGPAISLMVIATYYFYSLDEICKNGGFICMGQITGIITYAAVIVELIFKKNDTKAVAQAAVAGTRQVTEQSEEQVQSWGTKHQTVENTAQPQYVESHTEQEEGYNYAAQNAYTAPDVENEVLGNQEMYSNKADQI